MHDMYQQTNSNCTSEQSNYFSSKERKHTIFKNGIKQNIVKHVFGKVPDFRNTSPNVVEAYSSDSDCSSTFHCNNDRLASEDYRRDSHYKRQHRPTTNNKRGSDLESIEIGAAVPYRNTRRAILFESSRNTTGRSLSSDIVRKESNLHDNEALLSSRNPIINSRSADIISKRNSVLGRIEEEPSLSARDRTSDNTTSCLHRGSRGPAVFENRKTGLMAHGFSTDDEAVFENVETPTPIDRSKKINSVLNDYRNIPKVGNAEKVTVCKNIKQESAPTYRTTGRRNAVLTNVEVNLQENNTKGSISKDFGLKSWTTNISSRNLGVELLEKDGETTKSHRLSKSLILDGQSEFPYKYTWRNSNVNHLDEELKQNNDQKMGSCSDLRVGSGTCFRNLRNNSVFDSIGAAVATNTIGNAETDTHSRSKLESENTCRRMCLTSDLGHSDTASESNNSEQPSSAPPHSDVRNRSGVNNAAQINDVQKLSELTHFSNGNGKKLDFSCLRNDLNENNATNMPVSESVELKVKLYRNHREDGTNTDVGIDRCSTVGDKSSLREQIRTESVLSSKKCTRTSVFECLGTILEANNKGKEPVHENIETHSPPYQSARDSSARTPEKVPPENFEPYQSARDSTARNPEKMSTESFESKLITFKKPKRNSVFDHLEKVSRAINDGVLSSVNCDGKSPSGLRSARRSLFVDSLEEESRANKEMKTQLSKTLKHKPVSNENMKHVGNNQVTRSHSDFHALPCILESHETESQSSSYISQNHPHEGVSSSMLSKMSCSPTTQHLNTKKLSVFQQTQEQSMPVQSSVKERSSSENASELLSQQGERLVTMSSFNQFMEKPSPRRDSSVRLTQTFENTNDDSQRQIASLRCPAELDQMWHESSITSKCLTSESKVIGREASAGGCVIRPTSRSRQCRHVATAPNTFHSYCKRHRCQCDRRPYSAVDQTNVESVLPYCCSHATSIPHCNADDLPNKVRSSSYKSFNGSPMTGCCEPSTSVCHQFGEDLSKPFTTEIPELEVQQKKAQDVEYGIFSERIFDREVPVPTICQTNSISARNLPSNLKCSPLRPSPKMSLFSFHNNQNTILSHSENMVNMARFPKEQTDSDTNYVCLRERSPEFDHDTPSTENFRNDRTRLLTSPYRENSLSECVNQHSMMKSAQISQPLCQHDADNSSRSSGFCNEQPSYFGWDCLNAVKLARERIPYCYPSCFKTRDVCDSSCHLSYDVCQCCNPLTEPARHSKCPQSCSTLVSPCSDKIISCHCNRSSCSQYVFNKPPPSCCTNHDKESEMYERFFSCYHGKCFSLGERIFHQCLAYKRLICPHCNSEYVLPIHNKNSGKICVCGVKLCADTSQTTELNSCFQEPSPLCCCIKEHSFPPLFNDETSSNDNHHGGCLLVSNCGHERTHTHITTRSTPMTPKNLSEIIPVQLHSNKDKRDHKESHEEVYNDISLMKDVNLNAPVQLASGDLGEIFPSDEKEGAKDKFKTISGIKTAFKSGQPDNSSVAKRYIEQQEELTPDLKNISKRERQQENEVENEYEKQRGSPILKNKLNKSISSCKLNMNTHQHRKNVTTLQHNNGGGEVLSCDGISLSSVYSTSQEQTVNVHCNKSASGTSLRSKMCTVAGITDKVPVPIPFSRTKKHRSDQSVSASNTNVRGEALKTHAIELDNIDAVATLQSVEGSILMKALETSHEFEVAKGEETCVKHIRRSKLHRFPLENSNSPILIRRSRGRKLKERSRRGVKKDTTATMANSTNTPCASLEHTVLNQNAVKYDSVTSTIFNSNHEELTVSMSSQDKVQCDLGHEQPSVATEPGNIHALAVEHGICKENVQHVPEALVTADQDDGVIRELTFEDPPAMLQSAPSHPDTVASNAMTCDGNNPLVVNLMHDSVLLPHQASLTNSMESPGVAALPHVGPDVAEDIPTSGNSVSVMPRCMKKPRREVQFVRGTVFLFRREQGFTTVTEKPGPALGMCRSHCRVKSFSLEAVDKTPEGTGSPLSGVKRRGRKKKVRKVPPRERQQLLRSARIQIDPTELQESEEIRQSRKRCGCKCFPTCLPEVCQCAQLSLSCLVEEREFPCVCMEGGCGNPFGRLEYTKQNYKRYAHKKLRECNSDVYWSGKSQSRLLTDGAIKLGGDKGRLVARMVSNGGQS